MSLPGQSQRPRARPGLSFCIIQAELCLGYRSGNFFFLDQLDSALCYQLSDKDALKLHEVWAHDVRVFAASKAFQGGVSLDHILLACHWKSHLHSILFEGCGLS